MFCSQPFCTWKLFTNLWTCLLGSFMIEKIKVEGLPNCMCGGGAAFPRLESWSDYKGKSQLTTAFYAPTSWVWIQLLLPTLLARLSDRADHTFTLSAPNEPFHPWLTFASNIVTAIKKIISTVAVVSIIRKFRIQVTWMPSRRDYVPVFSIKGLNQSLWNLSWIKEEMGNREGDPAKNRSRKWIPSKDRGTRHHMRKTEKWEIMMSN